MVCSHWSIFMSSEMGCVVTNITIHIWHPKIILSLWMDAVPIVIWMTTLADMQPVHDDKKYSTLS